MSPGVVAGARSNATCDGLNCENNKIFATERLDVNDSLGLYLAAAAALAVCHSSSCSPVQNRTSLCPRM